MTGGIIAIMVAVGRYFLTQKTRLRLSAAENKVRMLRTSMFDAKEYEFPLEHLEGAEVQQSRSRGDGSSTRRATSGVQLVFTNTRPATRVALSGWSISGGGAGMLADAVNDWLRAWHERQPAR